MTRLAVAAISLVLAVTACKKEPAGQAADPPQEPPRPTEGQPPTAPAGATAALADYVEIDAKAPIGPQMAQLAKAAAAAGKKAFAYLHADWCEPCNAIAATRTKDPRMKDAFAGTVILGLDVDHVPLQQLNDQSLPYQVIPVFYRLDSAGVPDGHSIDGGAWDDNIPENMAPPLKAFFST